MVWPWLAAAVVVWWLQASAILIAEHRRPDRAVSWMFILLLLPLPLIGLIPYALVNGGSTGASGSRNRRGRHDSAGREHAEGKRDAAISGHSGSEERTVEGKNDGNSEDKRLYYTLQLATGAPITACNGTEVLTDGEAAFASIFSMIDKAEHHLHLAYYIIRSDEIGRKFQQALIRKARDGVQVRLIYDGFGSHKLGRAYIRELEDAGVKTRCFLPLRSALAGRRINHRYHRKLIVVDGKSGFTGGINIGDEYLGGDKRLGYWRDTHLRVEGDAVYELQHIFVRDWQLASGEMLDDPAYWPPHACTSHERVQILSSGPGLGGNKILDGLLAAVGAAKERIYIATPYFIPDCGLASALRMAAKRGVDVRLIVPGIADSNLVLAATLSHAADLQAAGVRVYRYQRGFIHAKVMLVDRMTASVGTANLDLRSFYSNYELNALLFDEKPIKRLEEDFIHDFANSREVTGAELRGLAMGERAGRAFARLLSPLL